MNILLVQTAFLGDLILSSGLLETLLEIYPKSQIDLIVRPGLEALFKGHPSVRVFTLRKSGSIFFQIKDFCKLILLLRTKKYDLCLCAHRSFRSLILSVFSGAKKTLGFRNWFTGFFFSYTVDGSDLILNPSASRKSALQPSRLNVKKISYGEKLLRLLAPLGVSLPKNAHLPRLPHFERSLKKISHRPLRAVLVLDSTWKTKEWGDRSFFDLGKEIRKQYGYEVIYLALKNRGDPHLEGNLTGKTSLLEWIHQIQQAQFVVTNDSAALHVASAFQIPSIALFGPTVPEFGFFPLASSSYVVETQGLRCRPCSSHGPQQCPQKHFLCMRSISVSEVMRAIFQVQRNLPE